MSFLTKDGRYIGDIKTGWWYYKNGFKVCEDYPNGVALASEGFYGYTHRGGQYFTLGDKLFDENWVPSESEVKKSWVDYYEQSTGKTFKLENLSELISFIPFKERGSVVITNMNQCKYAAINMSKYLS